MDIDRLFLIIVIAIACPLLLPEILDEEDIEGEEDTK